MGDVVYVIYRGNKLHVGGNGQLAYLTEGGANRAIGHAVRFDVQCAMHNARITEETFDEAEFKRKIRKEYRVAKFAEVDAQ